MNAHRILHEANLTEPQEMRLVPVWLLERVERSLGSFTSDLGWAQSDMDTMDSVSALIAAPAHAPAQEAPVPQGRPVWLLVREDDESDAVMMYFEKPDETGFKDRFKLREFVLVERATTAPAPAAGILDRARWGEQVANLMRLAEAADKAVASMTVPAPEAGSESKIVIDVGPGGSGGGPAEAVPSGRANSPRACARGGLTDADLLNWIEHQDLEELSMGIVIDAAHDGEYYVNGDDNVTYYGKTLREALKKALRAKGESCERHAMPVLRI